ncbi:MAG: penicillin acylase family protein [Myxococcales bacterium]|nr:penicillin acylase family protein [Myxococcales bacterium]
MARSSQPPSAGAEATVYIDPWQVPHVHAPERTGVARGYGWAQMRAYPEELMRLYAVARGRGAEIWGDRYRTSDRMVRTLAIPQRAEAALAARSPELRAYLEAFAQGIDDYARAHPERIPEQARAVLPIRAADVLAHAHRILMAFTLLTGQRPLVVTIDGEVTPYVAGSNLWAIGPSRSASGHAMLLANPHLPWGPAALRMFEAHLVGPDPPLYGATLLGFPLPLLGFNDAIAWSHTVNVIDAADAYALVPDGDGYRLDGERRAFDSHVETVLVRQDDGELVPERLEIRRSVHGPVVELVDGRLLAIRAAIDDDYGGWAEAWLAMGRARDLPSFEAALQTMHLPMFTVGYADRDGHVLYLSAGQIPQRASGRFGDWHQPLPGDRSELVWDALLPYEALPRVVDPPGGFVQNSNSVPWLATLPVALDPAARSPSLPPPWPLGMREIHGLRLLTADRSITFDELRDMQRSSRAELADHVLDDLVLAGRLSDDWTTQRAAEVLARWDRRLDADSRGAALFEAWLHRTLGSPAGQTAVPWSAEHPLDTPWGLADPRAAARELGAAARELEQRFGAMDVAWGEVNRLRDGLPGTGGSGETLGSFHTIEYAPGPDGRGRPVAGDTFVALVELTPRGPRAEVLLTYGNASPDAPFAADELDRVASGVMRRPLLDRAEIEASAVESIHLPRAASVEGR